MKDKFKHYIPLGKGAIEELWKKASIILDASALLTLYRMTADSRNFILKILADKKISSRLWLPYQVALEYHRNRVTAIFSQTKIHGEIEQKLSMAAKSLTDEIQSLKINEEHPYIEKNEIIKVINDGILNIKKKINDSATKYSNLTYEDEILSQIHRLYDNKFGTEPDNVMLVEYKQEAEERYKLDIPPGYKDKNKPGDAKYGDYYIWKEIISYTKTNQLPVIFVTDDGRDDWWHAPQGKKFGVRYEMREEFIKETGQEIIICSLASFAESVKKYLQMPEGRDPYLNVFLHEMDNIKSNKIFLKYKDINYKNHLSMPDILPFSSGDIWSDNYKNNLINVLNNPNLQEKLGALENKAFFNKFIKFCREKNIKNELSVEDQKILELFLDEEK